MTDIIGTQYNEVLTGTTDDDTITGLSGYDTMDGGEGSDVYIVTLTDFQSRYVDFYVDSGTSGVDTIRAEVAGIDIGIGHGFSAASSGIEAIEGLGGSRIIGDNENQDWDFTDVTITGVDVLFGNGGTDLIRGSIAADTIDGGDNADELYGGLGNDTIFGGSGHDILYGENGRDTLNGGEGHDQLFGGNSRDYLFGDAGHDKLYGGAGSDRLIGGEGYDYLDGGEGSDVYYVGLENAGFVDEYQDSGETGRDRIIATEANTVIGLMTGFHTKSGIEVIWSGRNANVTIGGDNDMQVWDFTNVKLGGIQWINGLGGNDDITGNGRRNRIDGGEGNDTIDGGAGNDVLFGGAGHDTIYGGEGRDRIDGGTGYNTLDGGEGNDVYQFTLEGQGGVTTITDSGTSVKDRAIAMSDDVVIGLSNGFSIANGVEIISGRKFSNVTIGGDNDAQVWDFTDVKLYKIAAINAGGGMDVIHGSNRKDVINGESGHDNLYGGNGWDTLNGGADSDFLFGEAGRDTLNGGTGNDILDGGAGRDILTGGEGYDIFNFDALSRRDLITDFTIGEDLIDVRAFKFGFDDITMRDVDGGVLVDFGPAEVILTGLELDMITADMFIF